MTKLVLGAAVIALAISFAGGVLDVASASEQPAAVADGSSAADLETEREAGENDVVGVQVWTLMAVGAAVAVLLLALLLRVAMGWVKPPPPQEETPH